MHNPKGRWRSKIIDPYCCEAKTRLPLIWSDYRLISVTRMSQIDLKRSVKRRKAPGGRGFVSSLPCDRRADRHLKR